MAEDEYIGFNIDLHVDIDKAEKNLDNALGRLKQKAKGGIDLSMPDHATDSVNRFTTSLNNLSKVNLGKTVSELGKIKSAMDGIDRSIVIDVVVSRNSTSALDSVYRKLNEVNSHAHDFNQSMNRMADNTTEQINRQVGAIDRLMNKMASLAAENQRLSNKSVSVGQSPVVSSGPSISTGRGTASDDARHVEAALSGLQGVLSRNVLGFAKNIEVIRDKFGDFGNFDSATGKIRLNLEKGAKTLSQTLVHEISHAYATALPNERDFIAELNKLANSDKSLRGIKEMIKSKYKITDPNELIHEVFSHVLEGKFMGKKYNMGEDARKFFQSHFDNFFAAEAKIFASKGLNQGGGNGNLERMRAEKEAQLKERAALEAKMAEADGKFLARGGKGYVLHQNKMRQLTEAYVAIQNRISKLDNQITAAEAVGAKPILGPKSATRTTQQLKAGELSALIGGGSGGPGDPSDGPQNKKPRTPRAERISKTKEVVESLGNALDDTNRKFEAFVQRVGSMVAAIGGSNGELKSLIADVKELGTAVKSVKGNSKIDIRLSGTIGTAIGNAAGSATPISGGGGHHHGGPDLSMMPSEREQNRAKGAAIISDAARMDKKFGRQSLVASSDWVADANGNMSNEVVVKLRGSFHRILNTWDKQTGKLQSEFLYASKDLKKVADKLKVNESGLKEMDPKLAELLTDKASYIARTAEGLGKVQRIIATRVNGELKHALHTMEQGKKSTVQLFDDQFSAISAMDPKLQNAGERTIAARMGQDRRDAALGSASGTLANADSAIKTGNRKQIDETSLAIAAEIKKLKELGDTSIETAKKIKELETAQQRLARAAHLDDRAFRAQAFMSDLEAEKARLGTAGRKGRLNDKAVESIARDTDTNRLVKTVTDVHRVGNNYIQTTQKMSQAEDGSWKTIDLTTKALKNKADALKAVTSLTGKHTRSILDMIETAGKVIVSYGLISQTMNLIKNGIRSVISESVKLEKAKFDVIKILDEEQIQYSTLALKQEAANKLLEKSIEISKVFGVSTEEVMSVQRDFIALYRDTNDAINATVSANKLAIATNIPLVDSTKNIVAVASQFGLTAKGVDHFVDSLNEITNKLPTVDAGKLVENIQRMGSVAASSGVSLDRMMTLTAIGMQKGGESAAQVGNALKGFFADLKAPEKRNYLSEYLGLDKKELIKKDANEIMDLLQKRGADIESQAAKLEAIGTKEGVQKAKDLRAQTDTFAARFSGKNQFARIYSTIMTSGAQQEDLYDTEAKRVRGSQGSAEQEATIQLQSAKKKMDIFLASTRAFGARFGTMLLPHIKQALDKMTDFFVRLDDNREEIQKNIIGFGNAIRPVTDFLKGAFDGVNTTVKTTIELFGNLLSVTNAIVGAIGKVSSLFGGEGSAENAGRTMGVIGAVGAATMFSRNFIAEKTGGGDSNQEASVLIKEAGTGFRNEVRAAASEFRAGVSANVPVSGALSMDANSADPKKRKFVNSTSNIQSKLRLPENATFSSKQVLEETKRGRLVANLATGEIIKATLSETQNGLKKAKFDGIRGAFSNIATSARESVGKMSTSVSGSFSRMGASISSISGPGTRLGGVLGGLKNVALGLINPINLAATGMTLLIDRIMQLNNNLDKGNQAYSDGQGYLRKTVVGKNGHTREIKGKFTQDLDSMLAEREQFKSQLKSLEEKEKKGLLKPESAEQKQLNEYRELGASLKQKYGEDVDSKLNDYISAVNEYNAAFEAQNDLNSKAGKKKTLKELTPEERRQWDMTQARGITQDFYHSSSGREEAAKRLDSAKARADFARKAVEGDASAIHRVMVPYSNKNPRNNNSNGSNLGGTVDDSSKGESASGKVLKGASNYLDVARNRFDAVKDRMSANEISTATGEIDLRGAYVENMRKEISLAKERLAEADKLAKTEEDIIAVKEFEQNIQKLIIDQSREILDVRTRQREEIIQIREAELSINRALAQAGKTALEASYDSIKFGKEEVAIGREKINNILKEANDEKALGLGQERKKSISSLRNKLDQERLALIQKANDLISEQNKLIENQFEIATKTASVFGDMANSDTARAGIDLVSAQLDAMQVKTKIQNELIVGEEKTNEEIRTRIKLLDAEANYVKAIKDQGVRKSNIGLEYAGEYGSSLAQNRQLRADFANSQRRQANSGKLLSETRESHQEYAGLGLEQLGEESTALRGQYEGRLSFLAEQNPNSDFTNKLEKFRKARVIANTTAGKPEDRIKREAEQAKNLATELETAAQNMAQKDVILDAIMKKQAVVGKLVFLTSQNTEDQIKTESDLLAIKRSDADIEKQRYDLSNRRLQLQMSYIDLQQSRAERSWSDNIFTKSVFDNQRKANIEKQEINNLEKNNIDQGFIADLINAELAKGKEASEANIEAWTRQLSGLKLEEEEIKIKITANRESLDSLTQALLDISKEFGNSFRNAFSSAIAKTISGPDAKKIEDLTDKLKDITQRNLEAKDRLRDLDQEAMDEIAPPDEFTQKRRAMDKRARERRNILADIDKNNREAGQAQRDLDQENNPFGRFQASLDKELKGGLEKANEKLFSSVGTSIVSAIENPGAFLQSITGGKLPGGSSKDDKFGQSVNIFALGAGDIKKASEILTGKLAGGGPSGTNPLNGIANGITNGSDSPSSAIENITKTVLDNGNAISSDGAIELAPPPGWTNEQPSIIDKIGPGNIAMFSNMLAAPLASGAREIMASQGIGPKQDERTGAGAMGANIGRLLGASAAFTPLAPLAPLLAIGGDLAGGFIGEQVFGGTEREAKAAAATKAEEERQRLENEEIKRRNEMLRYLEAQANYSKIQADWQKVTAENSKTNARLVAATGQTFKSAGEIIQDDISLISTASLISGRYLQPATNGMINDGTELPKFDKGGLLPNTSRYDGIQATLHKGEMILPQEISQGMIELIRYGNMGIGNNDANKIAGSFVSGINPSPVIDITSGIERAFKDMVLPEISANVKANIQMPEALPSMEMDVNPRINMPKLPAQNVEVNPVVKDGMKNNGSGNGGNAGGMGDIEKKTHLNRARGIN